MQIKFGECWLPCNSKSLVVLAAVYIEMYSTVNLPFCFILVLNLHSHIKGGGQIEIV